MSIREVIAIATVTVALQGVGHAQTLRLLPTKNAPRSHPVTSPRRTAAQGKRAATLRGARHGIHVLTPKSSKAQSKSRFRQLPRRRIIVVPDTAPKAGKGIHVLRRSGGKAARGRAPGVQQPNAERRRIIVVPNSAPNAGKGAHMLRQLGGNAARGRAPARRQPKAAGRRIMLGAIGGSAAKRPPAKARQPRPSSSGTARLAGEMSELTQEIRELRHLLERLERRIGNRRGRRRR